ncbi:MAG TPA: hypothetical protein VHZ03_16010 [Trebonia sp.]|jgi:hypothetical protein|nr:hypothetical protein [Trebonia sp.]
MGQHLTHLSGTDRPAGVDPRLQPLPQNRRPGPRHPAQPDRQPIHQPDRGVVLIFVLLLDFGPAERLRASGVRQEKSHSQSGRNTGFGGNIRLNSQALGDVHLTLAVDVDPARPDRPRIKQPHTLQQLLRARIRRQQQPHIPAQRPDQIAPLPPREKRHN